MTRRTVLTTVAGPTAASTGLAAFSGFRGRPLGGALDVEPGNGRNAINSRSRGMMRVAVLTTDTFDPTEEEVRYRFGSPEGVENSGGAKPVRYRVEDVDGDGSDDLVSFFRTTEAGFRSDETEAVLHWDRDEGREHGLSGRDAVTTVGSR